LGRSKIKIILIVVLLLFALISLPTVFSRSVRRPVLSAASPVLKVVRAIFDRAAMAVKVIFTTNNPHDQLKEKTLYLRQKDAEITTLQSEVKRLTEITSQQARVETLEYTFIPATIIGREPSRWRNGAILNKGTKSGVAVGQAVVAGKNFVGRITEAGAEWSRAGFIIDPESSVPGQLEKSGFVGLVSGRSTGKLNMDYIDQEAEIGPGDTVITAYFAEAEARVRTVLPSGFILGKIETVIVKERGWYKAATMTPACDFNRLGNVLIIKTGPSDEAP
jgi:rod shape-determining protein MreC